MSKDIGFRQLPTAAPTLGAILACAMLLAGGLSSAAPQIVNAFLKSQKQVSGTVSIGIGESLWRQRIPPDNPMTQAKISFGEALYFDKRRSSDRTVSCATCHDPVSAFTDHEMVATGVAGRVGVRNVPTILNAAFSERLFWDGRARSLEEQAKQPLTNQFEMGMESYDTVVKRVSAIPEYRTRFRRVFRSEGITIETIVKAIAAYERMQISDNSPFDRFIAGDLEAMSTDQKRGGELFRGKAGCIECHQYEHESPFFSDFKFHNTGIAPKENDDFQSLSTMTKERGGAAEIPISARSHTAGISELGRYLVTMQGKDIGAFKTPT